MGGGVSDIDIDLNLVVFDFDLVIDLVNNIESINNKFKNIKIKIKIKIIINNKFFNYNFIIK